MFRNSQLLQRSNKTKQTDSDQEWRPVAILADPYEAEAGVLAPILNRFGFCVHEARDGGAALGLAYKYRASLVVASVDMPLLTGPQLCQKIRERNGLDTPFILISPKDVSPDRVAGHETFASDYAHRPVNLEDFETRLGAVLRAHRPDVAATRSALERAAPAPPPTPPPNPHPPAVAVQEASLAIAPIDTDAIDTLLTESYFAEHDVRREAAELYKGAFVFVNSAISAAQSGSPIPVENGMEIARGLVRSVGSEKSLVMLAMDRTSPFSFRQHSVNVAIIGTRIAQTLRLTEDRIVRLCLAGMLHDLGNIKLPKKLTVKHLGFSSGERSQMMRRPVYSAELVSHSAGFEWLAPIVLQVYERENGSGYPHRLHGYEISEESKILGVADVFEACIHRRPQRAAMTGYRALEVITSESDSFDDRITKAMIRSFSVYPFNELVVLNTGEIGKVIDINSENPLRPFVRIMYSVERIKLETPRVVDLSRNSQVWIATAITPDELPGIDSRSSR